VIKHVLVVVFIALAAYSERGLLPKLSDQQPQTLNRFRLTLGINLALGLLILLLTTAAQSA
jgi:hypothetical protein